MSSISFLFDFGKPTHVRTYYGSFQVPRYVLHTSYPNKVRDLGNDVPIHMMYQAHSIVKNDNGQLTWLKKRSGKKDEPLSSDEAEEYLMNILKSESLESLR